MGDKMVHFGIMGTAEVSRKICRAIAMAPNATLSAIGSRSMEKASKFALDNGLSREVKMYGCYEAVLDDPEIDVVYIPLPTSLHLRWAVLAAEKNKHVLLEKPVALNVSDLDNILNACEANGVQFMDGTMWMHNPRTAKIKEFLSDPHKFGHLKSVCHSHSQSQSCNSYNITFRHVFLYNISFFNFTQKKEKKKKQPFGSLDFGFNLDFVPHLQNVTYLLHF